MQRVPAMTDGGDPATAGADPVRWQAVSAQFGPCAVTMLPRHRTVVVSANGAVMVLPEAQAWQLEKALAEVRRQVVRGDGAAPR